jgi:hypothetical protein
MSPEWVHGSPHVEDLALPKSLKSCNFTLAKAVIRWMSALFTGAAICSGAVKGLRPGSLFLSEHCEQRVKSP